MSFFTEADDLRVVERNIQRLQGIEERKSKDMVKVFMLGRERIKQSLLSATTGTFTEASLILSLNQVDAILNQIKVVTKKENVEGSDIATEQSITDLGREINRFSKEFEGISRVIPVDEILLSMDSQNLLINRYQSSLDRYTDGMRDRIQRELTQAILSSEPSVRLVNRLNDELKAQEWQILRIARTELHNIYNMGKNEGMVEIKDTLIPDLKKSLFHPMDSRTADDSKLASRLNLVVDIDKAFKYNFKGQERVFFTPPDRPNDRSIITAYRKAWDK